MKKGSKHTKESIEKMKEGWKKWPHSPYWLGKKNPHKKETIEKIVKANSKNGVLEYFKNNKFKGESHYKWKGDNVSYAPLHQWLYRELGQPDTCYFCKRSGLKGKMIHWANKSGKYQRKLSDWLRLCAKCHYAYDRK